MIAPFSKKPLSLTLQGITTDDKDLSVSVARCYPEANRTLIEKKKKVDMIRTVTLPHLELFGISDGLELRVSAVCLTSQEDHPFQFQDKKTGFSTSRRW